MTAAQARAFGGPLDGEWFPVGSAPVYYLDDAELDKLAMAAGPVAAAPPEPRFYWLAGVAFGDKLTGERTHGLAYVENEADHVALTDGVDFVTRLAMLARGHR